MKRRISQGGGNAQALQCGCHKGEADLLSIVFSTTVPWYHVPPRCPAPAPQHTNPSQTQTRSLTPPPPSSNPASAPARFAHDRHRLALRDSQSSERDESEPLCAAPS
eukprot:845953-Rhodomonas_salina.1